ncbi:MAG: response regulator [bacterium]|nr:response regulator [bacterium]
MADRAHPQKHILIVEDEESLANALQTKFVKEGYRASIARDGVEGLEKATTTHPDIVVVDLIMPKMSGMEMMTALRKDPWGKDVPLVVLTNLSVDSGDLIRGVVKVKPTYYLVKSDWGLGEIVEKVNSIVQKP